MSVSTCWIESAAKGRHGGPVRAGMWSAVVVGTYPSDTAVEVWLALQVGERDFGCLPGFRLQIKPPNQLWHVPIPPMGVEQRLRYRAFARLKDGHVISSDPLDAVVRANLPERGETDELTLPGGTALVGNRQMTARVDARGVTTDVYYPTVGLHSNVRPAEGDQPRSRTNFQAILGGLALGQRIDWFHERTRWNATQRYRDESNVLETTLHWRGGAIRVEQTDFVAVSGTCPTNQGGGEAPGQYFKRFRIINSGHTDREALFGVAVSAVINGGFGDVSLLWRDEDRVLIAANRGHGHANVKLGRLATLEFALALDDRGEIRYEPTGPFSGMLLRHLTLPAQGEAVVDLLVSGAFTGWLNDTHTYDFWIRPALEWFRSTDHDQLEARADEAWRTFAQGLPRLDLGRPDREAIFRRAALIAALHGDAHHGGFAAGYDRGLNAYCVPRQVAMTADLFSRLGQFDLALSAFDWLARVVQDQPTHRYWFGKYTIDGVPEWETPAIDQTAIIPWVLERHLKRAGDASLVQRFWPIIQRAAEVCMGDAGHPAIRWLDDLRLVRSAGLWDRRYGAFLHSNCAIVAGLRASARMARMLGHTQLATAWEERADLIWRQGILGESDATESLHCGQSHTDPTPAQVGSNHDTTVTSPASPPALLDKSSSPPRPGLVDPITGRFLDARRFSKVHHFWPDDPELLIDASPTISINLLSAHLPFGLLPPDDPRVVRSAEAILNFNRLPDDQLALVRWSHDPARSADSALELGLIPEPELSALATLWMARYLLQRGRETGRVEDLRAGLDFLDALLSRLDDLGTRLRVSARPRSETERMEQGLLMFYVWLLDLHLDLAGLEIDLLNRVVQLRPILLPDWPRIGLERDLPDGSIGYKLEQSQDSQGHQFHLTVTSRLADSLRLEVAVVCPHSGQFDRTSWLVRGDPSPIPIASLPRFDSTRRHLEFETVLPAGCWQGRWSWRCLPVSTSSWVTAVTSPPAADPAPHTPRFAQETKSNPARL
ncbi:glycosyl hydrolase [Isosphaera pallida]|nr:glycosyl hydrolase [Isosphaera pallida]